MLEANGYKHSSTTGGHHQYVNADMEELARKRGIKMPDNIKSSASAQQPAWLVVVPEDLKGFGTAKTIISQMKWCNGVLEQEARREERAHEARRIREERLSQIKAVWDFKKAVHDFCLKRNGVTEMPAAPALAVAGGMQNTARALKA